MIVLLKNNKKAQINNMKDLEYLIDTELGFSVLQAYREILNDYIEEIEAESYSQVDTEQERIADGYLSLLQECLENLDELKKDISKQRLNKQELTNMICDIYDQIYKNI